MSDSNQIWDDEFFDWRIVDVSSSMGRRSFLTYIQLSSILFTPFGIEP